MALPLILCLAATAASAAPSGSFADYLLRRGDFDAATLEFRRELFESRDPSARPALARGLLSAGVLSRDYDRALQLSREVEEEHPSDEALRCVAVAYRGRAAYGLRNYRLASETFQSAASCPEPERSYAGYWAGLSALRRGDAADARAHLESVAASSPRAEPARRLDAQADAGVRLPRRSPPLAAGLNALLPGAGYAYADSPGAAAAAFITNALFIWATYRTAVSGDTGAAGVLGLISFAWYFGGVYGGAAAAERHNRRAADRFFSPFELD